MLITPRLTLRAAAVDDAAALHVIFSDPEAMRYWSCPPHTRLAQTIAWLDGMIASPANGHSDFLIEHDGGVVGKVGCWRQWEIGFMLRPDRWGRGLAREAATAVIGHIFRLGDADAIVADVDPRNHPSLRLLGALGFIETGRASGTMQVGEELCDSVFLKLARPQP